MMTQIIPFPQRVNNKIIGDFYPLQAQELIALRKAKLINNATFVHLALRFENPYCDRPIEIIPKEFALRWGIPESSVYEAVAKLKDKGILKIKTGRVVVQWSTDSQQEDDSDNPEFFRDPRIDSESSEKFPESQKNFPDPRKISQSSENQSLETLQHKGCNSSKTIQTIQTLQTLQTEDGGEEKG